LINQKKMFRDRFVQDPKPRNSFMKWISDFIFQIAGIPQSANLKSLKVDKKDYFQALRGAIKGCCLQGLFL